MTPLKMGVLILNTFGKVLDWRRSKAGKIICVGISMPSNQLLIAVLVFPGTIFEQGQKAFLFCSANISKSKMCPGKKFCFAWPHWRSIEGLTGKWRHQQKANFAPKKVGPSFLVTMMVRNLKLIVTEALVTFKTFFR